MVLPPGRGILGSKRLQGQGRGRGRPVPANIAPPGQVDIQAVSRAGGACRHCQAGQWRFRSGGDGGKAYPCTPDGHRFYPPSRRASASSPPYHRQLHSPEIGPSLRYPFSSEELGPRPFHFPERSWSSTIQPLPRLWLFCWLTFWRNESHWACTNNRDGTSPFVQPKTQRAPPTGVPGKHQ
jgi:hypothetical protein